VAKKRYGPFPPLQDYSPGKALEEMVRAGVETAFLSLPTRLGDDPVTMRPEAVGFAREVNEYGARIASDHEGRFGLFAFLPLPDVDASLREIEYAFDTLGAHGVGLMTSYAGSWLGDRAFQPVFEELDRRHALVYSHPTDGPCCHDLQSNTIQTVEWNTDTSRAIWSVINDGTDRPPLTAPGPSMATRHANITFVWSHGGGTLLGLIGRFLGRGGTRNVDLSQAPAPDSKLHHLRRFYYDTALSANRVQMRGLQELVGSARIVFGSDYPFMPILDTVDGLKRCGFSPEELNGIDRTNALRILPSWGSR
jgi:predicted TIM-barrel fold metal-dependent hydrolase